VEPVPGTRTVRRTVRVAVSLLLGQALLCAVIGWVTYRYSPAHRHRGPTVVDQLADAPRRHPKPAEVRPAETSPGPRATNRPRTRAPVPRSTAPPSFPVPTLSAQPVISLPVTLPAPPVTPVPPAPSAPPVSLAPTALPARPPNSPVPSVDLFPPGPVQQPVTVGEPCHPLGAIGRTAKGTEVRCLRTRTHRQRWKIV
jgi:hypothetical protein